MVAVKEGGEGARGEGGAETGEGTVEEEGEMVALGGEMEEGDEEEVMEEAEEVGRVSDAKEGMYKGDRGDEKVLEAKVET